MKKLSKLQINPARLLNVEELIRFKGGYDGSCQCLCATYHPDAEICGTIYAADGNCNSACVNANGCTDGTHTWGECL